MLIDWQPTSAIAAKAISAAHDAQWESPPPVRYTLSIERHSDAVMKNLIGDDVRDWRALMSEPAAKLHLYGKTEIRPGRKMGHVTRLSTKSS